MGTDHVIGWVTDGDTSYLGCRSCRGADPCPVMAALHAGYNGYRALARRGFDGIEADRLPAVHEAYEIMGDLLYPIEVADAS